MEKEPADDNFRACVLNGYENEQLLKAINGLHGISLEDVEAMIRQLEKRKGSSGGRAKITPSLLRDKLKALNSSASIDSIVPLMAQKSELSPKQLFDLIEEASEGDEDGLLLRGLRLAEGEGGLIDRAKVNKLMAVFNMDEMKKEEFEALVRFFGDKGVLTAESMLSTIDKLQKAASLKFH